MSESSECEDIEMQEKQSDEEVASDVDGDDNAASEETDDNEESAAEEPDVNASATESDEDDDEGDDDDDVPDTKGPEPTNLVDKITKAMRERHEKRKGRQLYIRFPEKLPENMEDFKKKVKSLSELIVESHKPRQKHARFCLVDFATTEDRDKTMKELSKKNSKIVVSLPKTDSEEFLQSLVDKKIMQTEKRRAKSLLRKQSKKSVVQKTFTPIVLVLNLPSSATTTQIKELFPNAVDIQTKAASGRYVGKMIATVTLPSTEDAKKNVKRKLELGGNQLIIRFNTEARKRDYKKKKLPKKTAISDNESTNLAEKKPKVVSVSSNAKAAKKPKPNKNGKPAPNGKPGKKPKKQNKQKNQPPKKGSGVRAPVE